MFGATASTSGIAFICHPKCVWARVPGDTRVRIHMSEAMPVSVLGHGMAWATNHICNHASDHNHARPQTNKLSTVCFKQSVAAAKSNVIGQPMSMSLIKISAHMNPSPTLDEDLHI